MPCRGKTMWKQVLQAFKGTDNINSITNEFMEMLRLTREMSELVHPHMFENKIQTDIRTELYKMDIKVNKLERSIRKMIVGHLNSGGERVTYCLLIMSVIKDAERIGDYLKNISEVPGIATCDLPDDTITNKLRQLVNLAMKILNETPDIIAKEDAERATALLQEGRAAAQECDQLLSNLAQSNYSAAQTTAMVLLTRFHKRLGAHAMNILSSVVMPLHKIDFYDGRVSEDPSTN